MKEGIDDHLVDLRTTVKYKNGETKKLHGVGKTVSLEDIKDQDFEVVSLASYDIIIVPETTCTKVEKTVKGTMVTMYEKKSERLKQTEHQQHTTLNRYYVVNVYELIINISSLKQERLFFAGINMFSPTQSHLFGF